MAAKKSWAGVDIGHHSIKVVTAEATLSGIKITKSGMVATPEEAIRDGVVVETKLVGAAIKAAMKEAHISCHDVVVAAAGGAVFVRPVPFPKLSAQMLRQSVIYEAGRYVPGSIEDSYVEAEIIGDIDETQMNVLLVAAPKDTVNSRIEACKVAGLNVEVVEIESFASYRVIVENNPAEDYSHKVVAILDIGSASTSVTVIQNGIFAMQRSMPAGGNALTDALKTTFRLETPDAEAGKCVLDLAELLQPGPAENPPLKIIQPHVDDMIREVRRSLNYYQSQHQSEAQAKQIDAIFITGGGAKLKGLAAYMSQKLGLRVEAIGAFSNPNFIHASGAEDAGLDLTVATGLAMRSFAKAA